jgi:F-type H+-transporting ATPase subunit delta
MAQELATLARPYASAIFAIAKSDGRLDEWSRVLRVLAAAAATPKVQELLSLPALSAEQKASQLAGLFAGELDDKARHFLDVLARNKRWDLFDAISAQFEALRASEQRALDVEAVSAFELSEAQRQQLEQSLRRRFGSEVRLTTSVDPALLGGVLIRAGDTVIDGSIRGRLAKLSESLQLA